MQQPKWAKGKKTAEILMHLSRWGEVLEISAERMSKAAGIDERKELLEQELGLDRWLIVIDNVWELDLAKRLQLEASNCAYLITTRNPMVANPFAPHNSIPVSELSVADGQELITQLTQDAVKNYPQQVEKLVRAVDGLPLSLILLGSYLRAESESGQPRHLENAFEKFAQPSALLRSFEIWELTNRARAYDNHVYIVACNGVGPDAGGNYYFGHSLIVSPIAQKLAQARGTEEIISAELDPDPIKRITYGSNSPMLFDHLRDRNLAAYRDILKPACSRFEPAPRLMP